MLRIDESKINNIDISGKGGKEKVILPIFENNLIRKNASLYDFIDSDTNKKYEIKKQQNIQYFDLKKYHTLLDSDKEITMVFIIYENKPIKGKITLVTTIQLNKFIDLVMDYNKTYIKWGWTSEALQLIKEIQKISPKNQTKAAANIKDLINEERNKFNILWEKKENIIQKDKR